MRYWIDHLSSLPLAPLAAERESSLKTRRNADRG